MLPHVFVIKTERLEIEGEGSETMSLWRPVLELQGSKRLGKEQLWSTLSAQKFLSKKKK